MSLAKNFGFDVPYTALIKDEKYSEYSLIIKRYDRYQNFKFHHNTVNTIMGKYSSDKYNNSINDVIDSLKYRISSDEFLILFKFIVFSLIISHGDLHTKNISIIYPLDFRDAVLSPMYDILTTAIYYNQQNRDDIGILINNKKKEISINELIKLANLMGVNEKTAEEIIITFANEFLSTFLDHIEKLPTEIKTMRMIISGYGRSTLSKVFNKYFDKRKLYINKYLLNKPIKKENIF